MGTMRRKGISALLGLIKATIADGFAPADARDLFESVVGVPALLERLGALQAVPGGASALL